MATALIDLLERATLFDELWARKALVEKHTTTSGIVEGSGLGPIVAALALLIENDVDGAIETLAPTYAVAVDGPSTAYRIHATMLLAKCLFRARRDDEAERLIDGMRAQSEACTDVERLAISWSVGKSHIQRRRYPEALSELHAALTLAEDTGRSECAARISADIATATSATGDVVRSIALYERSLLTLHAAQRFETDCMVIRINLASLYQGIDRNADALREYDALLDLDLVRTTPSYALPISLNRAIALKRLDRLDEALEAYRAVEQQAEADASTMVHIRALLGLSDLWLKRNAHDNARAAAIEAVELAQRHDVRSLVAETRSAIAAVDHAEGKIDEAIEGLRAAFEWTLEIADNNSAVNFGTELVQWLAEAHRFQEAYTVQRRCAELQRAVYEKEIERTVELTSVRSRLDVERETIRHRDEERNKILHAVLPQHIAERLMSGETHIADTIDDVTILFADIVGFTRLASQMDAESLVSLLEELFSKLDEIAHQHGCERLKTIGDSYMAICGVSAIVADHTVRMTRVALDIMSGSADLPLATSQLRIGIHRGPVVAGVMSGARLSYDIWGDAVNVAARMEQRSMPGEIHCTEEVAFVLREHGDFTLEAREPINIHGKGLMQTYWVRPSCS
ncbi:MAG: hypothetical protein JSS89_01315 [Bacteroidetes bacterium]|nr:hypothetical protein [Bacteroidota bacterium]